MGPLETARREIALKDWRRIMLLKTHRVAHPMAVGEWERVGNFEGESFVALICGIEQGKKKSSTVMAYEKPNTVDDSTEAA